MLFTARNMSRSKMKMETPILTYTHEQQCDKGSETAQIYLMSYNNIVTHESVGGHDEMMEISEREELRIETVQPPAGDESQRCATIQTRAAATLVQ
ncbi:hypothetical protein Aduo_018097 [Ancylostoma duodenale]